MPLRWVIGIVLWGGCADPLDRVLAADADPAAGEVVYSAHCAVCHGAAGEGAQDGPDLRDEDDTLEQIAGKVLYGWGEMQPFGSVLTTQEVADVASYVETEIQGS